MRGPVEAKVAAGGWTGAVVSLLFGLAAQYRWFTPPSPYLTALIVTAVSTLAAYLARHTPRPQPVVPAPGDVEMLAALKYLLRKLASTSSTSAGAGTPVVVQPPSPDAGGQRLVSGRLSSTDGPIDDYPPSASAKQPPASAKP